MSYLNEYQRRSIRLPGYDYASPGGYFVTICVYGRQNLFGHVADHIMHINQMGEIVAREWLRSENVRCEIKMDEWIVMPNHMHAIVIIQNNPVGATGRSPLHDTHQPQGCAKHSLGSLIAGFKSSVTKQINALRQTPSIPVWQRNYYEHIIRSEPELNRIRRYIRDNPGNWAYDELNLGGQPKNFAC